MLMKASPMSRFQVHTLINCSVSGSVRSSESAFSLFCTRSVWGKIACFGFGKLDNFSTFRPVSSNIFPFA